MPRIEDYALIGDTRTAALVSRDGSMDWLSVPRFDSAACFAALVGTTDHGRWRIAPSARVVNRARAYRPGSLVLETTFTTESGKIRVIDCMPMEQGGPTIVRLVEGLEGSVPMRMDLALRFDYGRVVPWVRSEDHLVRAVAGPDGIVLRTPVETRGEGFTTVATFTVKPGDQVPFVLAWHRSYKPPPGPVDARRAIEATTKWWTEWSGRCRYNGPWRDAVMQSLIVLKALTYQPSGGIVAAATTSLPEWPGGTRNWDYRYCWLRDATFTLYSLLINGYQDEARDWRDWLLRSVAGDPSEIQTMYSPSGERDLVERTLPWLPGFEHSRPVRVGNAAVTQLQLDVYGEVLDVMHQARRAGLSADSWSWGLERALLAFLESGWQQPDEGIWEVRGPRQHFTHSKFMSWVAFDRGIKAVERFGLSGPVDQWRTIRDTIHADVCDKGFDKKRGCFTQAYGSRGIDASLLMMPHVGFLPADDPRVVGTVRAVEEDLLNDGLVHRYRSEDVDDGLPPGEGVFLACSFWLADVYAMQGRRDEALEIFERLLSLRNDVGLLSEQYDPAAKRLLGNMPQAFSHVSLINTAFNLTPNAAGPAQQRKQG